jgi:hypothetical protein
MFLSQSVYVLRPLHLHLAIDPLLPSTLVLGSPGNVLRTVDHFESVSHRLARESDNPLERPA